MFSFAVIDPGVDNSYNYSVAQTDLAGNPSGTDTLQWDRSADAFPPPEITFPTVSPFISNTDTLTILGTSCIDTFTVRLVQVSPAGSTVEVLLQRIPEDVLENPRLVAAEGKPGAEVPLDEYARPPPKASVGRGASSNGVGR